MSGSIKVRNVVLGEGMPKICVPLVGSALPELQAEAEALLALQPDLVEWRCDYFAEVERPEAVLEALRSLRAILGELPLIVTFRSAREGGEREITDGYYRELLGAAAASGAADIIDVELMQPEDTVRGLIADAHAAGVLVIVSNHDFQKTPSQEELVSRLRRAQELGADLPKLAVMPNSPEDVLTLLAATNEMRERYADLPIITMSMAGNGVISRLAGEIFGSVLTFGAAHKPSAPGQVAVRELRQVLELLHRSL